MTTRAFIGCLAILSLVLGSLFFFTQSQQAASAQSVETPLLYLKRGTLDARSTSLKVSSNSLDAPAPGSYQIVQFNRPVTEEDRTALESAGMQILEYLPDDAYLVRYPDASTLQSVSQLPQLYASLPFTQADKLDPALIQGLQEQKTDLGQALVTGWADDAGELDRDLAQLGLGRQFQATTDLLRQVLALPSVRWIEPYYPPVLLNDYSRNLLHVDTSAWAGAGLYGAGQTVAVADSGLDSGDLATLSADFSGKITAALPLPGVTGWTDTFGHGTHVAGSIAGKGVLSGANPATHTYTNSHAGLAPEAKLVIQSFQVQSNGSIQGIPIDYYQLFQPAYDAGARIHSNSWGGATGSPPDIGGVYTSGSQRTDQFIWDHPDLAIFFAAGNYGHDGTIASAGGSLTCNSDGNGKIDPDTIVSPATAKNVITVGAAESNRTTGGLAGSKYFQYGSCFAKAPISNDPITSNPATGLAAFSSRGPTDDQRVKPDLVAPGTNILSTASHYISSTFQGLWRFDPSLNYLYSNGTSMATPTAAGAGALVREWLIERQGVKNPNAAAIKAVLLNTTTDLAPGQYGTNPTTQEISNSLPNNDEGWGRVDLGFISAWAPYKIWLDDHTTGLSTNQNVPYTSTAAHPLQVLTSTIPLRIMLVWTDPPASPGAAKELVNDLDLVVTGPGGKTYYGNGGNGPDRLNNVEGVVINNPPVGQYTIQVSAFRVPTAKQPYALVVSGAFDAGQPSLSIPFSAQPLYALKGMIIHYQYTLTNNSGVGIDYLKAHDSFTPSNQLISSSVSLSPFSSYTGVFTWTVPSTQPSGPVSDILTVTGQSALDPKTTITITSTATIQIVDHLKVFLPLEQKSK